MTRKCILCKETNYKTKHSFFSAPKDAETRKKWKDAIGIPNYTVSAETYVCSKHFSDRDIISHWASGTPPHVVTIKYKKCRLRPGAVPTAHEIKKKSNLSTKNKNNQQDDDDDAVDDENEITERKTDDDNDDDEEEGEEEEEEYDFEVNRGFETKKPTFAKHTKKKSFLIPRTYMNNDNNKLKLNNQPVNEQNNEFHDLKNKTFTSQHHRNFDGDNCEEEMIISEQLDNNLDDNDNDNDDDGNNENQDGPTYYMKTENSQQLYYVKTIDENSETNFTENDVVNDDNLNEKTAETYPLIDENIDYNNINSYEYPQSHDDDDNDDEIIEVIEQDIDDGDNMAIWEHIKTEKNNLSSNNNGHNVETPMESHTSADPLKLNDAYDDDDDDDEEEVMLFEDLLDNYTEVMLPKGWSSLVESKGHDTSIIYAFMKTSMNGIPWIQKQVFIQSDMLMRCSAAGKELNPKIHNLIKEKKRVKVHSVDDVTDLLKEFDSRTICQGTFENISPAHMDNSVGYRDGINWRHVKCPLIINNGKTRCTKCSSLNIIAKRKKSKLPQAAESAELLDKERQIFILQKLLKEKTSRNDDKYNEKKMMINNHQSMLKFLDNIDIPNVQKVMIKECLKVPLFKDTTIEHSESWIFLSLRIYMESQRIYKYLLHNKYIKLPSVKIMKRYFNQIKTDIQFYKLFKKSIEKYGYSEEQLGEPS